MKYNCIKAAFLSSLIGLNLSSCTKDDLYQGTNQNQEEDIANLFNFATTQKVNLQVHYTVTEPYNILFSVYSAIPFTNESGQPELDVNMEPLLKGFTDQDGRYCHTVSLPTSVKEVYIYSFYIGVPHLLKAKVENGIILADENQAISLDEAFPVTTVRSTKAPIELLSYTEWNSRGRIDNEYRIKIENLPSDIIRSINNTIQESHDNSRYAMSTDFYISEDANVSIRYVDGTTSAHNTLGYYCYKGNIPPQSISELNRIVILPNAHKYSLGVHENDAVKLKFYNPETKQFSDIFPKGYTIGWFIINNGGANLSNGIVEGNGSFYSTTQYNPDNRPHTASFDIKSKNQTYRVLSLEDWGDNDYNDVIFTVQANPVTALGPVPEVRPDEKEVVISNTYKGILAFEDLWPYKGDFDMNDVVVKYESQVYIGEKDNKVIRTEDRFTLLWSGASLSNSFGYMLNTPTSNVTTVIDDNGHSFEGQGLEIDNHTATIMVAKSIHDYVTPLVSSPVFRVSNTFKERVSIDELGASPYNPFIVANGCSEYNRKEVHLVDQAPSERMNMELLYDSNNQDYSIPERGIYYRTKLDYPFAIQMPNITELGKFLDKKQEGISISFTFPYFDAWVKSDGKEHTDWYDYPIEK